MAHIARLNTAQRAFLLSKMTIIASVVQPWNICRSIEHKVLKAQSDPLVIVLQFCELDVRRDRRRRRTGWLECGTDAWPLPATRADLRSRPAPTPPLPVAPWRPHPPRHPAPGAPSAPAPP